VLITNENDLTQHYGNALLPDKDVPRHSERYMSAAKAFASNMTCPPTSPGVPGSMARRSCSSTTWSSASMPT
jgi:hypothetical protein